MDFTSLGVDDPKEQRSDTLGVGYLAASIRLVTVHLLNALVTAFTWESLVMDFMMVMCPYWKWIIMSLCKRPKADSSSKCGRDAIF